MALHLSGRLYHLVLDPMLSGLRRDIQKRIPAGASVLEAASGSGEQALLLASTGNNVLGIDLDAAMVGYAGNRIPATVRAQLSFRVADASSLSFVSDGEYDWSCISLALHAMHPSERVPVVRELRRVADKVLIADYSCPMKKSPGGVLVRSIERIAGGDHFRGYLDYQHSGGLEKLVRKAGFEILESGSSLNGLVRIISMV